MMAFDLTTVEPSSFMEFRDNWIKETGLESVGADRLFENAGLLELIELDISELKEYAQEIGCSVIERKRLVKGIMKLNGLESNTPSTPSSTTSTPPFSHSYSNLSNTEIPNLNKAKKTKKQPRKSSKTDTKEKKRIRKRKRTKSKSRSRTPRTPTPTSPNYSSSNTVGSSNIYNNYNHSSTSNDDDDNAPMYDPTGKTANSNTDHEDNYKTQTPKTFADLSTLITQAIEQLQTDGNATKNDIRQTFMHFRSKLTEREMKLLHDVDSTVDKKTRLLQTQLEYVKDNGDGQSELACDPNMCLDIEKQRILTSIICAGWVKGASSDNKEEQAMQERERKRRELYQQQYLTVERLKQITLFERDCATKQKETVRLTNEVQSEIEKINDRSRQCEYELAAARPLLEAAKQLVSSITKSQLNEIRVLKKPPAVVELVMSAVTVMLGNKIKSWRDIQKILSNPRFIPSVLDFDTFALKKKTRDECRKYVKHEDFNEERANKASKVAGPLVKWVKSQIEYSVLLDVVRPKQKEIKILSRKLNKKQKQLNMCIQVVNTLEMKISKSRGEINQMVENMIKLQDTYNFGGEDDGLKTLGDNMARYNTISL